MLQIVVSTHCSGTFKEVRLVTNKAGDTRLQKVILAHIRRTN